MLVCACEMMDQIHTLHGIRDGGKGSRRTNLWHCVVFVICTIKMRTE